MGEQARETILEGGTSCQRPAGPTPDGRQGRVRATVISEHR